MAQNQTGNIVQLIKENRYMDAENITRKQLDKDPNNHILFFLKGVCNIYMQKLDEAMIDLGECAYLNPQYTPAMHAFAYIFLKREDYESAFNKWISILEVDPKNKRAQKLLSQFKKKAPEPGLLHLNPGDYIPLPEIKKAKKKKTLRPFKLLLILILLSVILLNGYWLYRFWKGYSFKWLPDFSPGKHKMMFTYTEKEINFMKKNIFEHVGKQNYNRAIYIMNKIYLSNAPLSDKKLLKSWEARLEYPSKDKLNQNFSPKEVFNRPEVFRNCFVLWEGKASHVVQKDKVLTFSLSLASGNKIYAVFLSNYPLQNGENVKVLGKVLLKPNKNLELEIYHMEKQ